MTNPNLINPHLPGEPFELAGNRPAGVLLFHGFTSTVAEVRGLGEYLNGLGYTTAGVMLPGHGTQPSDLNLVRWQDWAGAGETAYQEMARRCERIYVGGESTGGLVALYLAAMHPEIAGILAYAPALRLPLKWWQQIQLWILARFMPDLAKGDLSGNTTWQGYRVNPLKGVLQLIRFGKRVNRLLPRIHQPLLVIQGRKDKTINQQSSQVVLERVSSAEKDLHWFEDSGHTVLLDDQKNEVFALTSRFLEKVEQKYFA